MSTGKVYVLKDMGEGELDVSTSIMEQMAKDLNATLIHLPLKYDLERIGLPGLLQLQKDIEGEIKRIKLLKKLEESKV